MYLKELEICGFKSFVDKTNIQFTPGISSIIGPNGCGKSNILDAIRWVLGEQNPRLLRASKMSDLIWGGSATRKSTSFAEATLVFSDVRNVISNFNFDELSITRRLYRSGESEYLINKTPCRLKDIENLFMDTGLGPHAYSVMEQGKIDQLLQMKPDERRFIFEEAAGITKYQVRKDEAIRKLVRTEENLLRINDIITEVKRQVNSVERQARAAKRYQEHETELRKLEVTFSKKEYERMIETFQELSGKLQESQTKSQTFLEQITGAEAEYETLRTRGGEIDTLNNKHRQEQSSLDSQIEKINSEIQVARSVITNSDEILSSLSGEIVLLEQQIQGLTGQQDTAKGNAKELETKVSNQKSVISQHQDSLNTILGELRQVEKSIQDGLNLQRQKNEQSAKLQGELGAIGAKLIGLSDKRTEISTNMSEKETNAAQLLSHVDEAKNLLAGYDQSIQDCRQRVNSLQQQMEDIKKQKNQLQQELDRIRQSLNTKQSRKISLLRLKESYEGYQSGTKTILQAHKSSVNSCAGIHSTVASVIKTDAKLEVAIESALGNALNYLIADRTEDAKSALGYLSQSNKGSATIISLDLVKPANLANLDHLLNNRDGVIGRASDLVQCDDQYRPIIQNLLGHIVIASDLDTAISLSRESDVRIEFITLTGERVHGYGAISGGSVKTPGLLAQDREISELDTQIKQLEIEIGEQQNKISTADIQFAELEQSRNIETQKAHEFEIQRATARQSLESLNSQHKRLNEEIQMLQSIRTSSLSEEERLNKRQTELQEGLKQLERDLQSGQQQIDLWRNSLGEITQKRESQNQLITQLQVESATLENEYRNLLVQVQQFENQLNGQRNLLRQKQEQKQQNENRKRDSEALIVQSEEKKIGLDKDRSVALEAIRLLAEEKVQVEEKINLLSRQLAELRRDSAQVQNTVHELEIQVHDFRWKIDNLCQRIQETYHLDIKEPIDIEDVDLSDEQAVNNRINELKLKIQKIGPVNFSALEEFEEAQKRYDLLKSQEDDTKSSIASLRASIQHINSTTKDLFMETFNAAQAKFHEVFRELFRGGTARLIMLDEENPLESGIDVIVQPPGKNLQSINLLSGGEKAMAAIALLFSIYLLKPSPVCILDEIDAPLDDVNIGRFTDMVKGMLDRSQFMMITHSKTHYGSCQYPLRSHHGRRRGFKNCRSQDNRRSPL